MHGGGGAGLQNVNSSTQSTTEPKRVDHTLKSNKTGINIDIGEKCFEGPRFPGVHLVHCLFMR